jgi:uncharacterized protein YndB with AHSA1/START domain
MDTTQPPSPRPAAPPFRKRVIIPSVILGTLALFLVGLVIRGTWADAAPRNPKTVEDGIICHLYQDPDGHKQVRCAMILEHPIDEVWAVVTDYDHFAEIFPTVESGTAEYLGKGHYRWTGVVTSAIGDWPIELEVHNVEGKEKMVASWHGTGEGVAFLEGNWTLWPTDKGQTLLVYTSEVELNRLPSFLVRNLLLSRQKTVVAALARAVATRHPPSP